MGYRELSQVIRKRQYCASPNERSVGRVVSAHTAWRDGRGERVMGSPVLAIYNLLQF